MTCDRRTRQPVAALHATSVGDDVLQLETFDNDGTTTIVVKGEIDMLTASLLAAALIEIPRERAVLIDMGSVVFMDSSGLQVLLTESARRASSGGSVRLINESNIVTRLLDVSGLGFLADASTQA